MLLTADEWERETHPQKYNENYVLNVLFIAVLRLNIVYMLAAYAIGPLMGGIYIVLRLGVYRYIQLNHVNKKDLKMILRYALPLVPNELSWSVIHASDRVFLNTDHQKG